MGSGQQAMKIKTIAECMESDAVMGILKPWKLA